MILTGPGRIANSPARSARRLGRRCALEPPEQLDGLRDDPLARPRLEEAVQAGPDLITPPVEAPPVGDVSDIVVGQLEDIRVAKGRATLDLLAERREELPGHAHQGYVADQ